jgi:NinB protein
MAERLTLALYNAQQAHRAFGNAWEHAKALLMAGHRLTLEIKPETRSSPQNARLHAMLTELSNRTAWHGEKLPMETWKRLCMAAWMREERQSPQLVPALDGNGVDIIYERTSKLSKAEMGRLMEWVEAFAAEQGINLGQWVDQDSGEVHNG